MKDKKLAEHLEIRVTFDSHMNDVGTMNGESSTNMATYLYPAGGYFVANIFK